MDASGQIDATRVFRTLWVGSAPPPGRTLRRAGFEEVILCAEELQIPAEEFSGVVVHHCPFDDTTSPSQDHLDTALWGARVAASAVSRGRQVLVTCMMGCNRSAFVCAAAIHLLTGAPGRECARIVSKKRRCALGPALQNGAFRSLLARL